MDDLARCAAIVAAARRVAVLTGAGVSAESGIPTFRGLGGLWNGRDPMSLATPEAFAADPALVWEFYNWRRELVGRAGGGAGHARPPQLVPGDRGQPRANAHQRRSRPVPPRQGRRCAPWGPGEAPAARSEWVHDLREPMSDLTNARSAAVCSM